MTIQTQAFTPPEFQPLKICTYKPTSKAKNKYFKLINTLKKTTTQQLQHLPQQPITLTQQLKTLNIIKKST